MGDSLAGGDPSEVRWRCGHQNRTSPTSLGGGGIQRRPQFAAEDSSAPGAGGMGSWCELEAVRKDWGGWGQPLPTGSTWLCLLTFTGSGEGKNNLGWGGGRKGWGSHSGGPPRGWAVPRHPSKNFPLVVVEEGSQVGVWAPWDAPLFYHPLPGWDEETRAQGGSRDWRGSGRMFRLWGSWCREVGRTLPLIGFHLLYNL